jgi:hypothetical protein
MKGNISIGELIFIKKYWRRKLIKNNFNPEKVENEVDKLTYTKELQNSL